MGFRMVSKSFTLNDHERRKVMTADARYLCGNRASRCGWATKNGQVYASVHPSVRLFNRATTAVQCVQKKKSKMFFCNIFHKTREILMKFGVPFPEEINYKVI